MYFSILELTNLGKYKKIIKNQHFQYCAGDRTTDSSFNFETRRGGCELDPYLGLALPVGGCLAY